MGVKDTYRFIKKNWKPILMGGIAGMAIQYFAFDPADRISKTSKVQEGYVDPSEIKYIKLMDVNLDDITEETIMNYKGEPRIFKINDRGNPEAFLFEISVKRY